MMKTGKMVMNLNVICTWNNCQNENWNMVTELLKFSTMQILQSFFSVNKFEAYFITHEYYHTNINSVSAYS
jgi:hypothetical protein